MSYPVSADINSSGSNNLGTKINGQVGGNCNSGTCEITGGTVSGINLFHRFSSFDTRGDIQKVNFEIGSQNNVIVGVTANTGTFINKPISLSSQGNLYWVSPGGIRTGSGADFINVSQLTLSTATSVHFSSGGVFDVFGNNSLHLPSVSSDPLPGSLGLINDPDQRTANGITGTPKILLEGIDITVDKSLLVDSPDGTVEVINSRLVATSADNVAGSITITGNEVRIDGDSQLLATGNEQGGLIQIGGSWQNSNPTVRQAIKTTIEYGAFLDVSAIYSGNGGTIVAWSDITNLLSMTLVSGTLKARGGEYGGSGGRIETSGAHLRTEKVIVDTGEGGEWLLDPYNYTITDNASISFTKNAIESSLTWDIKIADIDGDGDLDIIASFYDFSISWYENDGAAIPSYTKNLINSSSESRQYIQTADIDGDGDLDIVSASNNDSNISWYENDGAADPSWTTNTINSDTSRHTAFEIADLDNDGDLDIISVGSAGIKFHENDGANNPSFSESILVYGYIINAPDALKVFDIGNDGHLDIVVADGDQLSLIITDGAADPSFTYSGGISGVYSSPNTHHSPDLSLCHCYPGDANTNGYLFGVKGPEDIEIGDLDGDGDLDVVAAFNGAAGPASITWFEYEDSQTQDWTSRTLYVGEENLGDLFNNKEGFRDISVVDFDNDGDLDIVSTTATANGNGSLSWHENDGAADPTWSKNTIDSSNPYDIIEVADMNNDGDIDIVSTIRNYSTSGSISWYENDGAATWTPAFTAADINISANVARDLHIADIDSDGDLDIVSASSGDNTIAWYENDGAANPSWTASDISYTALGPRGIFLADIDSDGDLDIVSASSGDNTIAWYENDGAANPSWTAADISTTADGARNVFVADIDSDGDLDIVSASHDDDTIAWYENDGSSDPSFTKNVISTSADGARGVHIADIDSDGDLDIVSASRIDNKIAWYENDGAANPSWSTTTIATSAAGARDIHIADMDNDGDLDIVSASSGDDTIAWYENDGAANPSWTATDIATTADGARDVYVSDLDNDGDLDIVSASTFDDTIAWYENDGAANPTWTATDISISADGASSVFIADMDSDGDLDIISASRFDDTIAWYENAGGNHFNSTKDSLENALNAGTSVTITTTSASNSYVKSNDVTSGDGDIILNTNLDYTDGSGRLTLNAANEIEISNSFTLKSGSGGLELISSAGLTGSGSIIIDEDNASGDPSLTVEQSSNSTFSGSISGNGYFEKKGSGVLTLSANHTLTANDDIEAGQLIQPTTISIADVTTSNETASNATFTVSLSQASARDISFNYATSNGTATAGSDYTSTSGSLTISAGQTSGTFNVPILADSTDENNETATLTLSNATNSTFSDDTAILTITDDDTAILTITDNDDASSTLAIDSSSIEAIKNRPLSSSVPCPKCGNIHEGECLSSDRNKNKRKISTRPFNEVAKGLNNIHLFSKIIESTFQFPEKKKM